MDELKVGMRNNKDDRDRVRKIRALTYELEPNDTDPVDAPDLEDDTRVILKSDDVMVNFGEAVKATRTPEGLHVGGYLVRFSSPDQLDLTGDHFAPDTDFDREFPAKLTGYFHHGLDEHFKRTKLNKVDVRLDDFGVWAETILQERDQYEKFVAELAMSGKLGWSSGSAGHLVDRVPSGKGYKITSWPLVEASLTHTPAEPRNSVVPLKSLLSVDVQQAAEEPRPEAATEAPIKSSLPKEGNDMEITQEDLKAYALDAAKQAVEEYKRAEPATVKAGAVVVTRDEGDQPFENPGQFFQAVKNVEINHVEDVRLRPLKAPAGMSESVPADGGYLVSSSIAGGIIQRMYGIGNILSRVTMDNLGPNSNGMIYNAIDESSRVSTRHGGVLGYWGGEATSKTASAPKFRQLELKLKKVFALAYATDELLQDATALAGWLQREVPDELRFQTEAAFFYGDGAGKPQGIITSPALVSVTRLDATTIKLQDVANMYARRWGNGNYVWYVNREAIPQLIQMAGTYQYVWMPPGGVSGSPFSTLMGFPVIETEYASALGTLGDIVLADMAQYQAIQKGGVEAASSIHVKFVTDETAYRFVYRVDGAPMWKDPLTPHKGSGTLSPFVALTAAT
jgi:HK97 family phage major capsid protein